MSRSRAGQTRPGRDQQRQRSAGVEGGDGRGAGLQVGRGHRLRSGVRRGRPGGGRAGATAQSAAETAAAMRKNRRACFIATPFVVLADELSIVLDQPASGRAPDPPQGEEQRGCALRDRALRAHACAHLGDHGDGRPVWRGEHPGGAERERSHAAQLRTRPDPLRGEQAGGLPEPSCIDQVAEEPDGAHRFEPGRAVEAPRGGRGRRRGARGRRRSDRARGPPSRCRPAPMSRLVRCVTPRPGRRREQTDARGDQHDEEEDEAAADHGPMLAGRPREPQG